MRVPFSALVLAASSLAVLACTASPTDGPSVASGSSALSGCHGQASSTIPSSGDYFLTSFGFTPSDNGQMSCGEYTQDGSWYYAASRQRYGCGAHIQITANGKCVVAETDDYGPDVCVENAAGEPIIDASPLVSEHLFGTQSAGWSDRLAIHVTLVAPSTPLGICDGSVTTADAGSSDDGGSTGDDAGSTTTTGGATCYSATLQQTESEGVCVQASSNSLWYQCTAGGWVQGVSNGAGADGPCTASYPL